MDPRAARSITIIKKILDDQEIKTVKEFSDTLGFDRPEKIYKIMRGGGSISLKMAERINEVFPAYSVKYLLTFDPSSKITQQKNWDKESVIDYIVQNFDDFVKDEGFAKIVQAYRNRIASLKSEAEMREITKKKSG